MLGFSLFFHYIFTTKEEGIASLNTSIMKKDHRSGLYARITHSILFYLFGDELPKLYGHSSCSFFYGSRELFTFADIRSESRSHCAAPPYKEYVLYGIYLT